MQYKVLWGSMGATNWQMIHIDSIVKRTFGTLFFPEQLAYRWILLEMPLVLTVISASWILDWSMEGKLKGPLQIRYTACKWAVKRSSEVRKARTVLPWAKNLIAVLLSLVGSVTISMYLSRLAFEVDFVVGGSNSVCFWMQGPRQVCKAWHSIPWMIGMISGTLEIMSVLMYLVFNLGCLSLLIIIDCWANSSSCAWR